MCNKEYELINQESFELADIFECGQCFRWNKEDDGSYTGVVKNSVINVKKENNKVIFNGNSKDNFKQTIIDYFDLNTNYTEFKEKLSSIDKYLKASIEYGKRN